MLLKITPIQPGMSAEKKLPNFPRWRIRNWKTYCESNIFFYLEKKLQILNMNYLRPNLSCIVLNPLYSGPYNFMTSHTDLHSVQSAFYYNNFQKTYISFSWQNQVVLIPGFCFSRNKLSYSRNLSCT